jgi:hypothetical protein
MPTGRERSPLCPRCSMTVETCEHICTCQHSDAITSRRKLLDAFLSTLLQSHTPTYILKIFEYKLSLALELQYTMSYNSLTIPEDVYQELIQAIQHQNIVGWDNFLWGFSSVYWEIIFNKSHITTPAKYHIIDWGKSVVEAAITLYKGIWNDRNIFLHGNNHKEAAKNLRYRILNIVDQVYPNPPYPCFPKVTTIPLTTHKDHNTTALQKWLSRLDHQIIISQRLFKQAMEKQLTFEQAFW